MSRRASGAAIMGMVIATAAGCDGRVVIDVDGGPVPEPLVFDAAMLRDPADAGTPPRDAWVPRRDAGTPRVDAGRECTGVAYSCASMSTVSCSSQRGCSLDGECSGVAHSCYSQYSSYACNDQEGCYWSTYTESCSGSARSCYLMYSAFSCEDQAGCLWDETCGGYATPCHLLPTWECELQLGCRLQ